MRQGSNGRRPRSRHHGGNNAGGRDTASMSGGGRPRSAASLRHQSFDSNCGDLRVRGNAWQVYEKYQALARDAVSSGDRVTAENYSQHAEHYFRIIEAIEEATAVEQRVHGEPPSSFNQQPEIPVNYYSQEPVPNPVKSSQPDVAQQPAKVEATVQPRAPQATSSPFFTQEEIDEQNAQGATQPLALAR